MAKTWYDRPGIAGQRDLAERWMATRTIKRECPPLAEFLGDSGLVLDVGCGPGSITIDSARRLNRGHVIGIDNDSTVIDGARHRAEQARVTNIEFAVGDGRRLPFEDEYFDGVYAINVLAAAPEPLQLLREMARVTKPGGWVCANAPYRPAQMVVYPRCEALWRVLVARGSRDGISDDLGPNGYELLAEAGLEAAAVRIYDADLHYNRVLVSHQWPRLLGLDGERPGELQQLIDAGLIDESTVVDAAKELRAWHEHPHRFYTAVRFWLSGVVPLLFD